MSSVFVERLSPFWFQNDSKSTQVAQKPRCWNVSTPSESFWSVFEAESSNVVLINVMQSSFFLCWSSLCWNLERNLSEMHWNCNVLQRWSFLLQKHFRLTSRELKSFNILVFVQLVYFLNYNFCFFNALHFWKWKILVFLSFSVSIESFIIEKEQLSFSKSLLDIELVPCWAFSLFISTKSVKNLTKFA